MFKNYLKIALRNLYKNKGYSIINIVGLTVGLACFLLIALYIANEFSYDTYHEKGDRIYRVVHHSSPDNLDDRWIWGNAPIGPALKADFPEVVDKVQFSGRSEILLKYGETSFQENDCFYVDASVFDMFSWPLLSGDPKTALEAPYSIVLSETTAKKYFGDQDPVGKTIEGIGGRANNGDYTVTGVMQDIPANSHFKFDVLMSMASFYQSRPGIFDAWGYVDFYTYFLVGEDFNLNAFQAKMPAFLERRNPIDAEEYYYDVSFEPLSDAYLHSEAARQPGVTGSLANIQIFGIVGLFILIIASINFMNLATARSLERAKEVGVRKVIGAQRNGLVSQFLGESLLMAALASLFALLLVFAALPLMGRLTGKEFLFGDVLNGPVLLLFFGTALITGLLSGSYPAFVLSGFKPSQVLKGVFRNTGQGVNLRKGLVVFQFSLSIALIAGTIIVYNQLQFMMEKDMGFDQEQQLVIDFNWDGQVLDNMETIKNEFLNHPDVLSVAMSRTVPGSHFPAAGTEIETIEGEMEHFEPFIYEVGIDFIPHFDIEMVAGRPFSKEFATDTISALVINEAAARAFGYANPTDIIGKKFEQWSRTGEIIGVTKDFNYLSLHEKVAPLTIRNVSYGKYLALKIKSENLQRTIREIEGEWGRLAPHRPFLYSFLDTSFQEQYQADIRFRKVFTICSLLAIFIACLGLLGLATYSAMQRTKEIGVRKVLGADIGNIVALLSKEFIKLVLLAIIIATPFAWYAMNQWLDTYAYNVGTVWWAFLLAGLAAVVVAIATISFQAVKAARANPVKSLRTE